MDRYNTTSKAAECNFGVFLAKFTLKLSASIPLPFDLLQAVFYLKLDPFSHFSTVEFKPLRWPKSCACTGLKFSHTRCNSQRAALGVAARREHFYPNYKKASNKKIKKYRSNTNIDNKLRQEATAIFLTGKPLPLK
ncbi:hypothetical protein PV433_23625 [Paenibacillus sp. GYB004]|uniref:hypothetical protein n=1 Tax=Paenibacillus sp. GYB004 TaxID=2994393 RepID=UPI002F9661E6